MYPSNDAYLRLQPVFANSFAVLQTLANVQMDMVPCGDSCMLLPPVWSPSREVFSKKGQKELNEKMLFYCFFIFIFLKKRLPEQWLLMKVKCGCTKRYSKFKKIITLHLKSGHTQMSTNSGTSLTADSSSQPDISQGTDKFIQSPKPRL